MLPLIDDALPHALADLPSCNPRGVDRPRVRRVARDAVAGQIAALDASARRVLGR